MKAVLVVDMPMMCCECKFFRFANNDDWGSSETICTINGKHCENGYDYKPRVCPLRLLPKKLDANNWQRMFGGEYAIREAKGYGYNVCLEEITGENNESNISD